MNAVEIEQARTEFTAYFGLDHKYHYIRAAIHFASLYSKLIHH